MKSLLAFTCLALYSAAGVSAATTSCVGTINSLSGNTSSFSIYCGPLTNLIDVATAVGCTTVNINSFTVPAGQGFSLSLLTGTTVNLRKSHLCMTLSVP